VDFSTGSAEVLFVVECEPEFEDTVWARSCPCVQKDTDLRFQNSAERSEKPSNTISQILGSFEIPVRIDLFAVLLFETKDELHWWEISFSGGSIVWVRCDELLLGSKNNLRCHFKDMHGLE